MKRHGHSLRRLWYPPPVRGEGTAMRPNTSYLFSDTSRVAWLRDCCMLEELVLTIPRSMGDATEVEIYRSLGRLPKLQNLALTLDCEHLASDSEWQGASEQQTPIYSSFDEFDEEFAKISMSRFANEHGVRNGHVRIGIINAALDEMLARSIFATISNAKPTSKDVRLLEHLELRPIGGRYTRETQEIAEDVGLWWLLERSQRDDSRDVVLSTRLRYPGVLSEDNGLGPRLTDIEDEIFHRI